MNFQMRKIIKNRGHFPNDAAAIKLLWPGDPQHRGQASQRTRQGTGKPAVERKAPGRLVEGAVVQTWKRVLGELALTYPDRINPYL